MLAAQCAAAAWSVLRNAQWGWESPGLAVQRGPSARVNTTANRNLRLYPAFCAWPSEAAFLSEKIHVVLNLPCYFVQPRRWRSFVPPRLFPPAPGVLPEYTCHASCGCCLSMCL